MRLKNSSRKNPDEVKYAYPYNQRDSYAKPQSASRKYTYNLKKKSARRGMYEPVTRGTIVDDRERVSGYSSKNKRESARRRENYSPFSKPQQPLRVKL